MAQTVLMRVEEVVMGQTVHAADHFPESPWARVEAVMPAADAKGYIDLDLSSPDGKSRGRMRVKATNQIVVRVVA